MTEFNFKISYYNLNTGADDIGKITIVMLSDNCDIGLEMGAYKKAVFSAFMTAGKMGGDWRVGSIELMYVI